jgi:hypothetical protein
MRKKAQERFWSYRQLPRDKAAIERAQECMQTLRNNGQHREAEWLNNEVQRLHEAAQLSPIDADNFACAVIWCAHWEAPGRFKPKKPKSQSVKSSLVGQENTPMTKHSVIIAWGRDREHVEEYSFGTEAELLAFKHGVDEAIGWMECGEADEDELTTVRRQGIDR